MSDALFEEHLARGAAPAAAWGVFDADGLRHARQSGVAADTAFRIASCTKSFTAAALLSLRDEGLLGLDEPVTRSVPGLNLAGLPSAGSAVPTVRMLLTMSSGLPTDDPWADRQEAMTAAEFDALLAAGVRFEAEPGTRFAYSNLGYALLGRVIEVASGQSYQSVVAERLLAPLGLGSTGFETSVPAPGGVAVGHRRHSGSWEPLPFTGPGAFSAIGGLFSTVTDLSRWAGWLASAFSESTTADAADAVLSAASRREMQQLHRLDQTVTARPTGYGYGLFVEQYSPSSRVVSHSGGYPGFSAHMRWSLEQQLGVVAFSNATYSRVSATAAAAFDALLAEREAAEPAPLPALWPETRAAQRAVTELLAAWAAGHETPLDPALFSENVALDLPLERRTAALRLAVADIGGLTGDSTGGSPTDDCSDGPAHLAWFLPASSGRLRVEIRLTPEARPRVQTLLIAVDRAGR